MTLVGSYLSFQALSLSFTGNWGFTRPSDPFHQTSPAVTACRYGDMADPAILHKPSSRHCRADSRLCPCPMGSVLSDSILTSCPYEFLDFVIRIFQYRIVVVTVFLHPFPAFFCGFKYLPGKQFLRKTTVVYFRLVKNTESR